MEPIRKMVTTSPENSETPLDYAASWVTPNRLFFVRNHFNVPDVNRDGWELALEGLVTRPARWTFAQLAAMPQHSVFATVECAGNGRSFLQEKAAGVQWGAGAIGHAEWTGVRLRDLLEPAGLKPGALEVVFEGADRGTEPDHPAPMHFSRSLPLAKALHRDTLIALRMNGEWLDPNHGAPMRLFVPGWYGVASVKWLRVMRVIDEPYPGYFQTTKYSVDRVTDSGKRRIPLGPGVVKSEILQPGADAEVNPGINRIAGIAWAGEQKIETVWVSTDDGVSWEEARLKGMQEPYSWCQWEFLWTADKPGNYSIMARAQVESGERQPFKYDPNNLGYLINVVAPRVVSVREGGEVKSGFADDEMWADTMLAHAERNTQHRFDLELVFSGGEGI